MTLHYRQSLTTGLCLAFFVALFNSLPTRGLVYPQLINSGHAFVFFSANLFLLRLLLGSFGSFKQISFISTFSISVGLFIELVQPYFGRDKSILDFSYDILGVVFSALFFSQLAATSTKIKVFLLSTFICLSCLIPSLKLSLWWKINQSPVLLNFERSWEDQIYSLDKDVSLQKIPASKFFNAKGYAGKIIINSTDTYAGFSLNHAKNNWSDYSTLSWEMVSFNDYPISLILRVHDSIHNQEYNDRFNDKFTIVPGFNSFEVALRKIKTAPESREMTMENISNIKFFLKHAESNTILYIDNIQLQ
tara:strand:- start:6707 stop:7621 length:915 start_codon:yes stop_codon:yes gene_type:complete